MLWPRNKMLTVRDRQIIRVVCFNTKMNSGAEGARPRRHQRRLCHTNTTQKYECSTRTRQRAEAPNRQHKGGRKMGPRSSPDLSSGRVASSRSTFRQLSHPEGPERSLFLFQQSLPGTTFYRVVSGVTARGATEPPPGLVGRGHGRLELAPVARGSEALRTRLGAPVVALYGEDFYVKFGKNTGQFGP